MVSLPIQHRPTPGEPHGCGTQCGAGLEKVYPTTAVRYGAMNWLGEFRYRSGTVFKCGAKVIIQTERGTELGQQVSLSCNGCNKQVTREQVKAYIDASGAEFYRLSSGQILREATPADIDEARHLNAHVREDVAHCAELAERLGLDIKIVTAEHLFGGERVVYYFRSEERVDFRSLVRELAHHHRTRIEMRQVGARDEARLVADYEICGRECCCKNFLKKLRPVTMRMAKLQKSTLDPSKVSGRCGRLRCCLRYEHIGYEELNAKLPPVGSLVETAFGPADVIDRQVLTQLLLVRLPDEKQVTVPLEEIKSFTLPKDRETRTVVPERPEATEPPAAADLRKRGERPPAPNGKRDETAGPERSGRERGRRNAPERGGPRPQGGAAGERKPRDAAPPREVAGQRVGSPGDRLVPDEPAPPAEVEQVENQTEPVRPGPPDRDGPDGGNRGAASSTPGTPGFDHRSRHRRRRRRHRRGPGAPHTNRDGTQTDPPPPPQDT